MDVFISWSGESGELSRQVANLLHEWLKNVLQFVNPYVSSRDIEKGAAWFGNISSNLKASDYGLICLTADNLTSPWIHFEAGAIANRFDMNRISAILVNVSPTDVAPPLGQFQHTEPTEEDMFKLVGALNRLSKESALSETQLRNSFNKWWPDFEDGLLKARETAKSKAEEPQRTQEEILGKSWSYLGIHLEQLRSHLEKKNTLGASRRLPIRLPLLHSLEFLLWRGNANSLEKVYGSNGSILSLMLKEKAFVLARFCKMQITRA